MPSSSSWKSGNNNILRSVVGRRRRQREPQLPVVDMDICRNGKAGFTFSNLYALEDRPIGTGSFGSVYIAKHNRIVADDDDDDDKSRRTSSFAVKVIPKARMSYSGHPTRRKDVRCSSYDDMVRSCSEVQVLQRLRTEPPSILPVVYLYEVFLSSTSIYLVTDLLADELSKWRSERTECTEKMAMDVCRTLLDALEFLHGRGVVHRDVKMSNILFRRANDVRSLKIVDLGLARILRKGESVWPTLPNGQPNGDFFCGTPGHIPPEMYLGDQPYRFEVDLFALGVLVFRLLSGQHPFPGRDMHVQQRRTLELRYSVQDGDWHDRSDAAKDFVHRLIVRREDRMTVQEAKAHQWFREAGQSVLPPDDSYGGESNALRTSVKAPTLPKTTSRGRFWIDASLEVPLARLVCKGICSVQIVEASKLGMICVEERPPPRMRQAPEYIGSLSDGAYTEKDCRAICRQLARAIQILHKAGMAHRNLHVENVLIDPLGRVNLKGFRHAQPIIPGQPLTGNFDHRKIWWLYAYKAPEIERDFVHDKSVDLWSLGVTIYMLLTSMGPFRGEKDTLVLNKHSGNFVFDAVVPSRPAQELVKMLLQVDPANRPIVQQVLDSEWMVEADDVLEQYSLSLTHTLYKDRFVENEVKDESGKRNRCAT